MLETKLKELYSLYELGEYKKAIKINNEILLEDSDNIYAKRYISSTLIFLLAQYNPYG